MADLEGVQCMADVKKPRRTELNGISYRISRALMVSHSPPGGPPAARPRKIQHDRKQITFFRENGGGAGGGGGGAPGMAAAVPLRREACMGHRSARYQERAGHPRQ